MLKHSDKINSFLIKVKVCVQIYSINLPIDQWFPTFLAYTPLGRRYNTKGPLVKFFPSQASTV